MHPRKHDPATSTMAPGEASGAVAIVAAREPAASRFDVVEVDRYEITGELAKGGMGVILDAFDRRNRRRVAIKTLLGSHRDDVQRFVREATLTSRLQHPAIVTLHDTGRFESGQPFFAMKLIVGRSLREVIERAGSAKERLALLPHLIAVTEALAYAHGERIIHRDLKPSNVLVGAFGETVVIDWGLAKDLRAANERDAFCSNTPSADSFDAALTLAGTAMGTPGYMPPEQARGEEVDERADVYALGALLYHAFAGVPPYQPDSRREVLARVVAAAPDPLKTRAPELPHDLVAIVEKAMARDPRERYASAQPMAEDLRLFATGQLVSAYSYSMRALFARWVMRHRAVVMVAAALLVVLVAAGALGLRRIVQERDRADAASRAADAERSGALTQRDAAEALVEYLIGDLKSRLEPLGKLDLLAGVGAKVEGYYASAPSADAAPASLKRRAAALGTLAEVESRRHNGAAARSLYASSLALRQRVVELVGDDAAEGDLLEQKLRYAAFLSTEAGDAATQALLREVATGAAALDLKHPSTARWLAMMAESGRLVAAQRRAQGDIEGALVEARAALVVAHRLAEIDDLTDRAQAQLAAAYRVVGLLDFTKGTFDSPAIKRSVVILEALLERHPDDPVILADLGASYLTSALARRNLGDFPGAVAAAQRCRDVREVLVQRDARNVDWQQALASSYDTLCSVEQRAGRADDAVADCERSVAIGAKVVAKNPDAQLAQDSLFLAHERLGWVLREGRRYGRALEEFRAARAIAEDFAKRQPDDHVWQERLAEPSAMMAETYLAMGRRPEAYASYREALAVLERMGDSLPGYTAQRALVEVRLRVALFEIEGRQLAAAYRRIDRALGLFLAMSRVDVADEDFLVQLADSSAILARAVATRVYESPGARDRIERALVALEALRVPKQAPTRRLASLRDARRALASSSAHAD